MSKNEETVGISKSDLIEIINAVRTPVKTEEQIREEAQKIEDRATLAASLKEAEDMRKASKANCSHMRKDGSTIAVYVTSLNFMLCQACGDVIKPEERPEMFNRLFQLQAQ